jgi:GNAT superfamily N-acetyltransferase
MRIRAAQPDDVASLLGLIGELAEYESLTDAFKGDAHRLATALFEQKAAEALIAETDDEAVGYAVFFATFSTFECRPGLWIEDLFVKRARRGQGIGRALLAHIAGLAITRGCARLEWSALDWNEPALRFYDELGATRLEQWRALRLEGDALQRLGAR